MERKRVLHWFIGGAALGILNALVFTHFWADRPIGASTAYPYVAAKLLGITNEYAQKIAKAGLWEVWFLLGGLIGAFLVAVINKDFKPRLVYPFWEETKGGESLKAGPLRLCRRLSPHMGREDGGGLHQRAYPLGRYATGGFQYHLRAGRYSDGCYFRALVLP